MGFHRSSEFLDEAKRPNVEQFEGERSAKRLKVLLEEDDLSNGEDKVSSHGDEVPVLKEESESGSLGFKVNQEFANRFEHNKRREELHKRE